MATTAPRRSALSHERVFFLSMGLALALCTFIGFAQTYYLMRLTGSPGLTPIVHAHGIAFTAWILIFALQPALISAKRPDIHRMLGAASAGLAIAMVVLGVAVAVSRSMPPALSPFTREQFLIFPLTAIGLFALFVLCGIATRLQPGYHKRFMLLATMNVAFPAFARMTVLLPFLPRGAFGAMIIINIFLAALAAFDLKSLGRLHPVTLWGGGLTLAFEPLRIVIARSDWWQGVASALMN